MLPFGINELPHFQGGRSVVKTRVPDNTRIFSGYLFGAKNYKTITWDELMKLADEGRIANPFLNDVETLAFTAEEFVTYYAQALQGDFFQHGETLQEFPAFLRCATSSISSQFHWE